MNDKLKAGNGHVMFFIRSPKAFVDREDTEIFMKMYSKSVMKCIRCWRLYKSSRSWICNICIASFRTRFVRSFTQLLIVLYGSIVLHSIIFIWELSFCCLKCIILCTIFEFQCFILPILFRSLFSLPSYFRHVNKKQIFILIYWTSYLMVCITLFLARQFTVIYDFSILSI